MSNEPSQPSASRSERPGNGRGWEALWTNEDWCAVWLGLAILGISWTAVAIGAGTLASGVSSKVTNPLGPWIARPASWVANPLDALHPPGKPSQFPGLLVVAGALLLGFGGALSLMGVSFARYSRGFLAVFVLAGLAYVLAGQVVVKHYNLEYVLWALVVGLAISNTVGTPGWMLPAARTEFYIKTGLVLLGAEVLFGHLLSLGRPGICIAWIVTPIVLVTTYIFGQRVLRMPSKTLNIVICADMAVCGVSAAIATAAACRAKKEELSLAIGLSLLFTVVMMVVMPPIIRASGMGPIVGGAWIGGTIDATGAVAAAGELLGDKQGLYVAVTVKLIQNVLIGAVAFAVACYWAWVVDRQQGAQPSLVEIWDRFPKFILGFIGASLVFSWLHAQGGAYEGMVDAATKGCTVPLRGWLFCLGFVSIGLECDFRSLYVHVRDGKAFILYLAGQSLNLTLTLLMAWLMFNVVFPDVARSLLSEGG